MFCGCKPSQKNIEPHENFTGSYEKTVVVVDKLQDAISKVRKVNKSWQKLFDQH